MKVLTICLLLLACAVGCKKSSHAAGTGKDTGLAGNYKVSAVIVTRTYPCWPCLDSVPPAFVTAPFDTTIQVVHVNTDTFRFYGLDITNMDTQDGPDCPFEPEYCGFFATGTADSLNVVPINNDPGGFILA